MNKKNKIQTSTSRKVFMICDYALMLLITLICIYPFWYIIIYTFSEGSQVDVNPPVFLPRGFTLSNYKDIFELKGFFHSVLISVLRTVIGTWLPCCPVLSWDIFLQKRKCLSANSCIVF